MDLIGGLSSCVGWQWDVLVLTTAYFVVIALLVIWTRSTGKKFECKAAMMAHNLAMTALSAYMMIESARQAYLNGYTIWGNQLPHDPITRTNILD